MDYKRRTILTAAGAAAAMVATSRQLFAGWEPSERYPDPAVQALDPSFAKYRLLLAGIERLAVGMRWSEGRRDNGRPFRATPSLDLTPAAEALAAFIWHNSRVDPLGSHSREDYHVGVHASLQLH